jgi:hypothetical protein
MQHHTLLDIDLHYKHCGYHLPYKFRIKVTAEVHKNGSSSSGMFSIIWVSLRIETVGIPLFELDLGPWVESQV